jgi:hypothetical protein
MPTAQVEDITTHYGVHGSGEPLVLVAGLGAGGVGAHRRRTSLSPGTGYVAHGLLSHSPAPVTVVPVG